MRRDEQNAPETMIYLLLPPLSGDIERLVVSGA